MMNSRDALIVNKVFPPQLKHMMILMNTESFVVEKTKNFLHKTVKNALHENEAIPFDVCLMIELLQREITLPDISNEQFIQTPVFFGLSRKMQHNIILFLKSSLSSSSSLSSLPSSPTMSTLQSSPASTLSLDQWSCFLNNNSCLLDKWGKILIGQNSNNRKKNHKLTNEEKKYSKEYASSLCDESLQKLRHIASKVNFKHFDLTLVSHLNTDVTVTDDKQSGVIEYNDFLPLPDNMEMLSEVLHNGQSSSDEMINISSQTSQKNCLSSSQQIDNLPKDISSKQCFCDLFEVDISLVKEKLFLLKESNDTSLNDHIPPKFYILFNDCPNQDINGLCAKLELQSLPEACLCVLVLNICKQNELAFETSCVILSCTITVHLNKLKVPVSRNVFACLCDIFKVNQRLIIVGVLNKLLCSDSFSSFQEDVIKKLITNEHLKSDGVALLLDRCFENECVSISEEFVSMIEILLNTKPALSEICLRNMLKAIADNGAILSKSLKLMKLLVMLMKTYPEYTTGDKILLQKIVTQNTTFMRKTALNLIKNLP